MVDGRLGKRDTSTALERFRKSMKTLWDYFVFIKHSFDYTCQQAEEAVRRAASPEEAREIESQSVQLWTGSPALGFNLAVGQVTTTLRELANFIGPNGEGRQVMIRTTFIAVMDMFEAFLKDELRELLRAKPSLVRDGDPEKDVQEVFKHRYSIVVDHLNRFYNVDLRPLEYNQIVERFAARNVFVHNQGIVDQKYFDLIGQKGQSIHTVQRVPEGATKIELGDSYPLSEDNLALVICNMNVLAQKIDNAFKGI